MVCNNGPVVVFPDRSSVEEVLRLKRTGEFVRKTLADLEESFSVVSQGEWLDHLTISTYFGILLTWTVKPNAHESIYI